MSDDEFAIVEIDEDNFRSPTTRSPMKKLQANSNLKFINVYRAPLDQSSIMKVIEQYKQKCRDARNGSNLVKIEKKS